MFRTQSASQSSRRLVLNALALLGAGAIASSCSNAPTSTESATGSVSSQLSTGGPTAVRGETERQAVAAGVVSFAESARRSMLAGGSSQGAVRARALAHLHRTPDRWLTETAGSGDTATPQRPPEHVSASPAASSPALRANFNALTDDGSGIAPPDTNGAAGPNHLMVALNTQIVVQTKTGTDVSAASTTDNFWTPVLGSNFCSPTSTTTCTIFSDPHVVYDPYGQRWIFVGIGLDINPTTGQISNPGILLAVSQTTDPTGSWNEFKVAPPASVAIPDYPILGFNKNWISVSTNDFDQNGSPLGVSIYVFDKAAAYANTGNGKHTRFAAPNPDDFSVAGAFTYDPTVSTLYLLEDFDGTTGTLRLFEVTGAVGSEVLTQLPNVMVNSMPPWADTPPAATNCNFVPQAGTSAEICAGDSRITEVSYRNGHLWTANAAFLPVANPTHTASNFFEIDPATSSVTQATRVEDPTASQTSGNHYFYPAIVPNQYGDAFIGFSVGSPSTAISTGYSMRFAWDAPSTLRTPATYKTGTGTYNIGGFMDPRNRWGDFSITTVDPSDDLTMWTIQEYTSGNNLFGTWWAELGVDCNGQPDGTPCDNGSACSGSESCLAGTCTCSGSSDAGADACMPLTMCPAPDNCGTLPDGCGGTISCGTCTPNQTCTGNVCVTNPPDAGSDTGAPDSGPPQDSGTVPDAGTSDSGSPQDSGMPTDAGRDAAPDAGRDSGAPPDAGPRDSGVASNDASNQDAATSGGTGDNGGCGCRIVDAPSRSSSSMFFGIGALALLGALRRRRNPGLRRREL